LESTSAIHYTFKGWAAYKNGLIKSEVIMSHQSTESAPTSENDSRPLFALHYIVLIITWLATTVITIIMLLDGVRNTDQFQILRYLLQAVYVLALIWYLYRTGPSISELPAIQRLVFPAWRYGNWVPVFGVAFMSVLIAFTNDGLSILVLMLMIATVWILVVWRREIRFRMIIFGLVLGIMAFLLGLPYLTHGNVSKSVFILFLPFVPPMFVAGALLIKRTKLSRIQLLSGGFGKAIQSMLMGCLLFVPLGIFNAAEGSMGTDMHWITHWWQPFTLPWCSGIFEEIWFRLLIVSLCYFMLRPVFVKQPAIAILFSVLFSAISFGLGHDRTLEKLLTTGLLYGLPMAVVFISRDLEHSVGAHYMINMIPTLCIFIEN